MLWWDMFYLVMLWALLVAYAATWRMEGPNGSDGEDVDAEPLHRIGKGVWRSEEVTVCYTPTYLCQAPTRRHRPAVIFK